MNPQINDILVIEQTDFDYVFFLMNLYIVLLIVVVYVWFLDTLVDKCIGLDEKYIEFSSHPIVIAGETNIEKYTKKLRAYTKAKEKYEHDKISYMIILGLFSIIGGTLLTKSKDYALVGTSIAIGGSYLLIWFISQNRSMMNKNFEISSLGLTLITLIYLSINNF